MAQGFDTQVGHPGPPRLSKLGTAGVILPEVPSSIKVWNGCGINVFRAETATKTVGGAHQ